MGCWSACVVLVSLCGVGQHVWCRSACEVLVRVWGVGQRVWCWSACVVLVRVCGVGQRGGCWSVFVVLVSMCDVGQHVWCWSATDSQDLQITFLRLNCLKFNEPTCICERTHKFLVITLALDLIFLSPLKCEINFIE